MFHIDLTTPAKRSYFDLEEEDKKAIESAFREIADNPFWNPSRRIRKLKTIEKYRYRADHNWRIIYSINTTKRIVYIESIRKRREDTYRRVR